LENQDNGQGGGEALPPDQPSSRYYSFHINTIALPSPIKPIGSRTRNTVPRNKFNVKFQYFQIFAPAISLYPFQEEIDDRLFFHYSMLIFIDRISDD
jgi:hypothetical protein